MLKLLLPFDAMFLPATGGEEPFSECLAYEGLLSLSCPSIDERNTFGMHRDGGQFLFNQRKGAQ
jgi:hypothetical protein